MKTFCGWRDTQHPDGTIDWTDPDGHTYTTHPGSRLLFPTLCQPTAPVVVTSKTPPDHPARTHHMPRRKTTRTTNRAKAIHDERQRNEPHNTARITERNKPPPF
jgi:hypothetical protein